MKVEDIAYGEEQFDHWLEQVYLMVEESEGSTKDIPEGFIGPMSLELLKVNVIPYWTVGLELASSLNLGTGDIWWILQTTP